MPDGFRPDAVALALEAELRAAGRPERSEQERRYLRSDLEHLGASVPTVRAAVKGVRRDHPDLDHDAVVALAEALWRAPVHERRLAAVEVLRAWPDRLSTADLPLVERLVRESGTWALVDPLAIEVTGGIVAGESAAGGAVLDRWAADDDFWVRRAAVLALLRPLKAGGGDWPRFTRYADALVDEQEFFIRKAIGWVLREVGRSRPDLVVTWLAPRTDRASGVTVREAIKPLSDTDRERLLAAYRQRRPARPTV